MCLLMLTLKYSNVCVRACDATGVRECAFHVLRVRSKCARLRTCVPVL